MTLWTIAIQAPLSMGFSRQEYWNGVAISFLRESDLPNQGLNLDLSNCRQILYCLSQQGSLMVLLYFPFSTLGKSLNICMSSSFIFKMEIITYLPDQAVVMLKGDDTTSQCLEEWQVHCQCPINFTCYYDYLVGFPGGASGKESPCQCRRHKGWGFNSWVRKIPWRREW